MYVIAKSFRNASEDNTTACERYRAFRQLPYAISCLPGQHHSDKRLVQAVGAAEFS